MNQGVQALIDETLRYTRVESRPPGSCFLVNLAASELETCGPEALLHIESAVCARLQSRAWKGLDELSRQFPGIANLWLVYYRLSEKSQIERAVEFLRSLDGAVLASAISGLRCTWPYDEPGIVSMPQPLVDFLREVARTRDGEAGDIARKVCLLIE